MALAKNSRLVPVGIVLILLGLFVPQSLDQIARSISPGALRAFSFIATDLFRVGFFIGIACTIIGALRNRKLKQQQQSI
jgi:hypothetical protein